MGLRFRRSVRLFPGVRLNFSGSGISTSIGGRGAHVTYGHGHVRSTVGIPGTGLSWTSVSRRSPGQHASSRPTSPTTVIIVCLFLLMIVSSAMRSNRSGNTDQAPAATSTRPELAKVAAVAKFDRAISATEPHEPYFVATDVLNQRDNPNGTVVGTLHRGALVDVFETAQGWARISSGGNPSRWVSAKLLCKGEECATKRNEDDAAIR